MTAPRGTFAILLALAVHPLRADAIQDTTTASVTPITQDSVPSFFVPRRQATPMMALEGPPGAFAPGTRYRFTRQSMMWSGAFTLADLLGAIPGVYIARGGFFGQPEYVMYGGRGAASVELYWDGLPMYPMGGDSVYQDLGRISLSYLRQIDVAVSPGRLRVYLVSERHEQPEARSAIRVTSGSFSTTQYAGLFQRRWDSGLGINLAGDFGASEGAPDTRRNDQSLDLWAKAVWLPVPNRGVAYQVRRQNQERDPPTVADGVPERTGDRTDVLFKIFGAARPDRIGWGADLAVGATSWRNDSLTGDQTVRHGMASVGYARPNLNLTTLGKIGDARVRGELESRLSWIPISGVVVSGEGRWQSLSEQRTTRFGMASLGVYRGPFAATGQLATGQLVQAAALRSDSGQSVTDASARLALDMRRLSGSVSLVRRDAFLPVRIPDYVALVGMDSSAAASYFVADARLRPVDPLVLSAWYSHPRTTSADLQPPKHGRAAVTFRSKFWRTFRSGVFEFMVRYGIEYWSRGTAGLATNGDPVQFPGATFHEWFVQVQLVGFKAFWNLRNARNSSAEYVPGLAYPTNAQMFGVRWEFTN